MSKQHPDWYDPKLFRGRRSQPRSAKFGIWGFAKASALFLAIAFGVMAVLLVISRFV